MAAYAQNPRTLDSLRAVLRTSRPDTNRVDVLAQLAATYLSNERSPAKALRYSTEALQLAERLASKTRIVKALSRQGAAYAQLYNYPAAVACLHKAIALAGPTGDRQALARIYNSLGNIYLRQSAFGQALRYYQQTLSLDEALGDEIAVIGTLANIGNVYKDLGNFSESAFYLLKALRLAEKKGVTEDIAFIRIKLGILALEQGNGRKAEAYLSEALRLSRQINERQLIQYSLYYLGNTYAAREAYAEALACHQQALAASEPSGDFHLVINSLNSVGSIYLKKHQYGQAKAYFGKALRLAERVGDKRLVVTAASNLGWAFHRTKNYPRALRYARQSVQYARQVKVKEACKEGYEILAHTYKALGDHRRALLNHERYVTYRDSLQREANSDKLNKLQLQYETEKKEQQIRELSQQTQIHHLQLSQHRTYVLALVALVAITVVLSFLWVRQNRLKGRQKTMELEQKLLRSQMNPHFICNALTVIQKFIFQSNPAEASDYLARFARLMRLILENSREEYIPLHKEIQTLEHYCQLQHLRFKHTFEYRIYVDPALNPEETAVPPMFAQPLIENSLEHGILHRSEKGVVEVRYLLRGDQILLEVEDNGVGLRKSREINASGSKSHASLASQIIRERLGRTRKQARLTIEELRGADNQVQGTKASFTIPFKFI
jgi:tetratricopeptide (TPR) repeat protein